MTLSYKIICSNRAKKTSSAIKGNQIKCKRSTIPDKHIFVRSDCYTFPFLIVDEDCLYLNVFLPASTTKARDRKAVMVWIQGHNFTFGSSAHYPAHILASLNDVIVVTFNYRLGILGFLNIPGTDLKGNYGMQDQVYGSNRAVTHCKNVL